MTGTFSRKLRSTQNSPLYVVHGLDFTGQPCWYFVKVPQTQCASFDAKLAHGELMNLDDAGEILLSGYGSAPPPSAYEQMACKPTTNNP